MVSQSPLLILEGIVKSYPAAEGGSPLTVLDHLDLEVTAGEAVAVTGPSGSGKTTLLNLLGALDTPTSGRVVIDGEEVGSMDRDALAEFRNRKIGFVFQDHYLLPQCTVLENVVVPLLGSGKRERMSEGAERARKHLERVGLADRISHRPGQLSGGEQQRVALVRALINEPAVLLADEPTGSLDRRSSATLAELLLELNREEGITLIVVTHALKLAQQMRRSLELVDGKLQPASQEATP